MSKPRRGRPPKDHCDRKSAHRTAVAIYPTKGLLYRIAGYCKLLKKQRLPIYVAAAIHQALSAEPEGQELVHRCCDLCNFKAVCHDHNWISLSRAEIALRNGQVNRRHVKDENAQEA